MTASLVRVIVADDERPARSFLTALLAQIDDIAIVGEAANGTEAIQLIEQHRPDVAFLDLQMPDVDGMGVVRLLRKRFLPLIVFVTAYDEYAVKAFEVNAIDYLTKPVTETRLAETMRRVRERLERDDLREDTATRLRQAVRSYDDVRPVSRLDRIPVRRKDSILLLPVSQVCSVVADGELLHLTTIGQERHTITYRLKDLEARLDQSRFVRIGRGALVNIDHIQRVMAMPGGLYTVKLKNGQDLDVSRIQSRLLRDRLLQL
jgi:two-component system LytT family response regulator